MKKFLKNIWEVFVESRMAAAKATIRYYNY